MARIIVRDKHGDFYHDLTEEVVTFGRASQNTLQIRDQMSSRNHCEIRKVGGGYRLVDLESANGTQVNGKEINQHSLLDGDEVRIGDVVITFESSDLSRSRPTAL